MNTSLPHDNSPLETPPVIDGHVDLLYALMRRKIKGPLSSLPQGLFSPASLAQGNVRVLVAAFYCPDAHNGPLSAKAFLESQLRWWHDHIDGLCRIENRGQLDKTMRSTFAPGSLWLLENADVLADMEPETVWEMGFRIIGLTHACANRLGDGNAVLSPSGLTSVGRKMLPQLERCGFILDVAHLSDPSFNQTLEGTHTPLISSHTGLRSFCNIPRNLTEEQLRILFERGGMVGLSLAPEMLTGTPLAAVTDLVVQIDWLVQKFGAAQIALGSDLGGFEGQCRGLAHHGELKNLVRQLTQRGYPPPAIEGILGGNWKRFFAKHLPRENLQSENQKDAKASRALRNSEISSGTL